MGAEAGQRIGIQIIKKIHMGSLYKLPCSEFEKIATN